jgi:hypothetical protein
MTTVVDIQTAMECGNVFLPEVKVVQEVHVFCAAHKGGERAVMAVEHLIVDSPPHAGVAQLLHCVACVVVRCEFHNSST